MKAHGYKGYKKSAQEEYRKLTQRASRRPEIWRAILYFAARENTIYESAHLGSEFNKNAFPVSNVPLPGDPPEISSRSTTPSYSIHDRRESSPTVNESLKTSGTRPWDMPDFDNNNDENLQMMVRLKVRKRMQDIRKQSRTLSPNRTRIKQESQSPASPPRITRAQSKPTTRVTRSQTKRKPLKS